MDELGGGPPPAEQLLTVEQRVEAGAVVVSVLGEVDMLTAPRLRAAMDGALRSAVARRVVIDLSQVTFLASAGVTPAGTRVTMTSRPIPPRRLVPVRHKLA